MTAPAPYQCDGTHWQRNCEQMPVERGDLYVEICADMRCAHVKATCQHSKCSWNSFGTILLCNLCGRDAT